MTAQNQHRPASNVVGIGYRRDALFPPDHGTCDLLRGATVATWSLVAGAILLLAVVAFAPRNHVTPDTVMAGAPIGAALSQH